MSDFRVFLLGSPYVTVDGQAVEFRRKKALGVLAYLALSPAYSARRDTLLSLFWPEHDEEYARAGLRRTLAAITETAVRPWLVADRQTVALHPAHGLLMVDSTRLSTALQSHDIGALETAVQAYRDSFMAGFSLEDSVAFDEWQTQQAHAHELMLTQAYERLVAYYRDQNMPLLGLETARQWQARDPYHEGAQLASMHFLAVSNQSATALQHYRRYVQRLSDDLGAQPSAMLAEFTQNIERGHVQPLTVPRVVRVELLPPPPSLMIGREGALADVRQRLHPQHAPAEVIVQGYPGIGKTTLSAALAYDRTLHAEYPDGVLWAALGEQPSVAVLLDQWARALGLPEDTGQPLETQSARLRAHLAQRAVLLIVDDVWEVSHALPFRVGGARCATLMTTRFNDVARTLCSRADSLYKLPIIDDRAAMALMYTLAPALREADTPDLLELVHDLEGLPLALQVAGRLLHAEMSMGWGIGALVAELREGRRLLESQAPADRHEVALQASPTVSALLQRSVARLTADLQEKFALLGVFAPKPATFSLQAVSAIWREAAPQAAVRTLADRGLLEPSGDGRFQMHALLVMHARSMFQE
jgi:DNA-binding SARP family transcriptional activator